jgi:Polysaccharide lyase family 8, super-sandwich domain/Polysaccharide lyase family 8, N terminal alpha-helical domain/Polysaccharide lyase family 8, C-terminal beta-sandwich domain
VPIPSLFDRPTPTSAPRRAKQPKANRLCRPRLEQLEPRATPAADLLQNMVAEIMEQAPAVVPSVPYYLGLMRTDGSFRDLNYRGNSDASATDLQRHGTRLEVLSLAYKWSDASNARFNDGALKTRILQGWNYLATKGGRVTAPNWWWKDIGVPQGLSDGLVLMRSELNAKVRSQILTKYFGSVWTPTKLDGANLAYQAPMATIDGLLRGDTNRIRSVVSKLSSELFAYAGEGIQQDLSFLQHRLDGKLNYYSGSYGLVFARDASRVMRWVSGTPYAFSTAAIDQQVRFVVDGLAWLTRGDALDIPSQGRSITWAGFPTGAPLTLRNAMADLTPLGRRTGELLAGIDRYDNGISDTNFLSGNKVFWKGDALAHQRPSFMTTLRMLSSRTLRPETAAGANTRGFFEGDGFTMFVKDGDEFGALGEPEIMSAWDWQRLPGTTVEHNGIIPYYDMFKTATNSTGSSNLVGSASDGHYGVSAMDYRRSGVNLTAKKAWFFFDDEVVALGADIDNANGGASVFTSLNQVLLDGAVTVQDAAGRRTLSLGDSARLAGGAWIEHDGMGYVQLDSSSATTVQAQLQSGPSGLALPVFSAWVDHGTRPQNATYAYAVVPGVTADGVDAYAQALPIKVLANTVHVQAVQHLGLGQTQIAFYSPGSLQISDDLTVSVNQPANLIIKQVGNDLVITAADPRQALSSLTIDVSRQLTGLGAQSLATGLGTRITFPLPTGAFLGASMTRSFSGEPAPVAEGEAAARYVAALDGLMAMPAAAPLGLGSYLASQQSATPLPPTVYRAGRAAPPARAPIWQPTAQAAVGERLGRGHGGSLDFDIFGQRAVDVALGLWNEPGLRDEAA